MRGGQPKPTVLKLISGNPGKRPLNLAEPQPVGAVNKPKFLKGKAARIWGEYAPELIRLGILTAVDIHTFAAWCVLAGELETDAGRMTASRIAQMRAIGGCFGLDASARSRISTHGGGTPESDPAAKYFGKPAAR